LALSERDGLSEETGTQLMDALAPDEREPETLVYTPPQLADTAPAASAVAPVGSSVNLGLGSVTPPLDGPLTTSAPLGTAEASAATEQSGQSEPSGTPEIAAPQPSPSIPPLGQGTPEVPTTATPGLAPEAPPPPDSIPTIAFVPPEMLIRRKNAEASTRAIVMAPPLPPSLMTGSLRVQPPTTLPAPSGPPSGGIPTATIAAATGGIPAVSTPPHGVATDPPAPPTATGSPSGGPRRPRGAGPLSSRSRQVALAAVAVIVIIAVAVVLLNSHKSPSKIAAATVKPPSVVVKTITPGELSYSPKGNGFNRLGKGNWHTQSYNSANFGRLKPGVGLVLDLGSAQTVTAVSFNAETGPLTVDLRRADQKPADQDPAGLSDFTEVGTANKTVDGSTTLSGSGGGKHQYWMLWVSNLAPDSDSDGRYSATISDVKVQTLGG
jgi:hypothetical protein